MTWLPIPAAKRPERDVVFGLKDEVYAAFRKTLSAEWRMRTSTCLLSAGSGSPSSLRRASGNHSSTTSRARRSGFITHFSAAQIVELVFKFMWWSTNRASVTLGDDGPHDANRLTSFRYDETGAYVVEAG